MSLGARLKDLRIKKGQSLQDVADAVGASKPHIWELEGNRSKNPSIDLLTRLAKHFEVTVAYLIGESTAANAEMLVFGREFSGASEDVKKQILDMAEKLMGTDKDGR